MKQLIRKLMEELPNIQSPIDVKNKFIFPRPIKVRYAEVKNLYLAPYLGLQFLMPLGTLYSNQSKVKEIYKSGSRIADGTFMAFSFSVDEFKEVKLPFEYIHVIEGPESALPGLRGPLVLNYEARMQGKGKPTIALHANERVEEIADSMGLEKEEPLEFLGKTTYSYRKIYRRYKSYIEEREQILETLRKGYELINKKTSNISNIPLQVLVHTENLPVNKIPNLGKIYSIGIRQGEIDRESDEFMNQLDWNAIRADERVSFKISLIKPKLLQVQSRLTNYLGIKLV